MWYSQREEEKRKTGLGATLPDFKTYCRTTGAQTRANPCVHQHVWLSDQRWHTHAVENYTVIKRDSYWFTPQELALEKLN